MEVGTTHSPDADDGVNSYDQASAASQLVQMASHLMSQEPPHVVDALRCLEAICQAKRRFPSAIEADARVRAAEILLNYTRNSIKAKTHLDAAIQLSSAPENYLLRLRAIMLLAKVFQRPGFENFALAKHQLDLAARIAQNISETRLRDEWYSYSQFELARLHAGAGDMSAAIKAVTQLLSHYPNLRTEFRLAGTLSLTQLFLSVGDMQQAREQLNLLTTFFLQRNSQKKQQSNTATTLLNSPVDSISFPAALQPNGSSGTSYMSVLTELDLDPLEQDVYLLRLLFALRTGEYANCKSIEEEFLRWSQLKQLEIKEKQQNLTAPLRNFFSHWNANEISITSLLVISSAMRVQGNPSYAIEALRRAVEYANKLLDVEDEPFIRAIEDGRPITIDVRSDMNRLVKWIRFRVLITVELAHIDLIQCQYSAALKRITELLLLFGSFTSRHSALSRASGSLTTSLVNALDPLEFLLEFLLGQYCLCFDRLQKAAAHFNSAYTASSSGEDRNILFLICCLSSLSIQPMKTQEAISKYARTSPSTESPAASSLRLILESSSESDTTAALTKLERALEFANRSGVSQLSVSALNSIAMRTDASPSAGTNGATSLTKTRAFLETAFSIAFKTGDIRQQESIASTLVQLLKDSVKEASSPANTTSPSTKSDAEVLSQYSQFVAKLRSQIDAAQAAAEAIPLHHQIVGANIATELKAETIHASNGSAVTSTTMLVDSQPKQQNISQ